MSTVSGEGTVDEPYIISAKDQFMTLVKIINADKPDDEDTIPDGVTADDYAVFGISENYLTAWDKLNTAYYSVSCDIEVTNADHFWGIGCSDGFKGHMNFNNHKFVFQDCVYDVSTLADADNSVSGIYFGVIRQFGGDASKDVIGLDNIIIDGLRHIRYSIKHKPREPI